MPESGPTGTFPNGTKTEQLTTDSTGIASIWGIRWSSAPGSCNIAIMVRAGAETAGTVARVRIAAVPVTPAASFEVTVSARLPKPEPEPVSEQPSAPAVASVSEAPVTARRPGVMLTQTTGRVDRLPNPWAKRALILLGIAGGAGGFAAYKLTRPGAAPPAALGVVPTPLTLSAPSITIGKP